ncbi:DUF2062 domain-containing protein [Candidatus Uabimicrobium sp. HlEnr_7]|uniref:DUF2062 domain-containing protein n=1 Tax=Candidatus Uabimicrobium helgolandensis TaxID=3095367 RepID=UPI0035591D50
MAASTGLGFFMGIIPLWGFQMIIAVGAAHVFKLNKPVVLLFSNISIPPMIPFILFFSIQTGSIILDQKWLAITLHDINWAFCVTIMEHYIIGSVVFATLSGILSFIITWALLSLFRGKNTCR